MPTQEPRTIRPASAPTPRREPPIAAATVPEYLRAEGAVLTDSLIPLVNRFRARQSDDGTLSAPDPSDRALLLRIREEGAAWYRRHALDGQAAALEADIDGWLAAGLDSRPDFGRSRDALPEPVAGETVFLLACGHAQHGTPPGDGRLDCFFALYGKTPAPMPGGDRAGSSPVLIAGSEGFAPPAPASGPAPLPGPAPAPVPERAPDAVASVSVSVSGRGTPS
ncbi:hypothetical protein ACFY7C_03130 [Streptomyces sp. NPDC012769]|uniref:hypothetical protein n=1 Tax=Streptomyces sp. NPDC012769 TaxID=3364848 RepID=UPI003681B206